MANAILIWDKNEEFTEQLSWELGISQSDVLFSFNDLKKQEFLSTKDAIVVLLDTDLDNHYRTEYFGLEIVKYLRRDLRYNGLIVVHSTLSEDQIKSVVNDNKILFTSGIRLKQLTINGVDTSDLEELIKIVPKLSSDLLDDIHFNIFDNKGKIHELLHNLKNEINNFENVSDVEILILECKYILYQYQKKLKREIDPSIAIQLDNIFNLIINDIIEDIKCHPTNDNASNAFMYRNAGNIINKYINQIVELAPLSFDERESIQSEEINWQVLFLDDTEGVRNTVRNYFLEKKVICHVASTENEVYRILEEYSPYISLFICDIRLLDNNEHWCDRQGYDIIEQVNKRNDYPLVYSVLTSKKGTINKMVQQKRKYEILWFTKDDVINNIYSFNIYFDIIKKYAEENFTANAKFQPVYSAWNKPSTGFYYFPLKTYYKKHREQNHTIEEININSTVINWIFGLYDYKEWTSKLLNKYIDEDELKKFRYTKLLGRRIALALSASQSCSGKLIYSSMTGDNNNDDFKKFNDRMKQFYTRLALPNNPEKLVNEAISYYRGETSSLGMLYEEYEFLKNEFFEELFTDSIGLSSEKLIFEKFLKKTDDAFASNNIEQPLSLKRVISIIDNDGIPKLERLNSLFIDLKRNEHVIFKNLHQNQFFSTSNENIIGLLRSYDWVD